MSNIVAIIGRPNVGKSTLFNRLTESRSAIVNETPGTTRDRHYGKCEWGGREFTIIDTGGYISGSDDVFESEINKQVKMAVEESDIILFMVDVTAGITNMDESVVKLLRRSKKKVILIANKADNHERLNAAVEFYALGLGEIFAVSAVTGSGTGELLDEVVAHLNPDREMEEDDIPRFAVVGRPNVGKSSLVNALLGVERNIVTPVAGTTRDTINSRYSQFGFDFWLVDTAGLRKKGKVTDDIEFYSVLRTIRAIEDCDVCLLMLDATQGIESQDLNVFGLAERNHKGLVILVNKWDMVEEKDTMSTERYKELIYERIAPFRDVPIIFTSVTGKQRVLKALEAAVEVHENRKRRIKTHELNEVMLDIINRNPPPALKGKYIKVKFVTQLPGRYPSFAFFCNMPQYVKEPYKRFLENQIRANFNFSGSPMNIFFRQK